MGLDVLDLLGRGPIDYAHAWDEQRRIHAEVSAGVRPNTLIMLEHTSVYTAGKRTEPHERPADGTPVIEVDRGGKITWHGPGQLVGYPIVRLPEPVGVVDYVRRIEEALIALCSEFGVATGRVRGRSGVWLTADADRPERKIAAIGVRVAAQTTMHGFALNVAPDLRAYDAIVPCGLTGVGVTSLAAELTPPGVPRGVPTEVDTAPVGVAEVMRRLVPHLDEMLAFGAYEQSPDLSSMPGGHPPIPPEVETVTAQLSLR